MGMPTLGLFLYKKVKMKRRIDYPPVKVAVLIDGGFFIKRFNQLYNKDGAMSGEKVAEMLYTMAMRHVGARNTLYRIFYYDCYPLDKKYNHPLTKRAFDFSKTEAFRFKMDLLNALKRKRKVALRMGTLKDNHNWLIRPHAVKELLAGRKTIGDFCEEDIYLDIRQKGIDMKIGVDIASLALKRFVDTIVLFSGDSDFVPAAKLARREGIDFVLDPMKANVEPQLFEHIDGIYNATPFVVKEGK